jgi:hypothetical protein
VVGAAIDGTALPAHIAITYSTGDVSLEQINSNFSTVDLGHRSVTNSIAAAPSWFNSQIPGGNLFGVGGTNGNLYVLDMGVNLHAWYLLGGPSITTAPSADAAGDWFFGASDAYLHEVVQLPGQPAMVQVDAIGPLDGAAGSSAIAGACRSGLLCVYVATNQSTAYLTIFDRHTALINACIISSPSTCSGDNPRLWASLDIGATGTVRVTGWSYYSP